jgi:hypothetical protein
VNMLISLGTASFDQINDGVLKLLAEVITLVLGALAVRLGMLLHKKWGIDVPDPVWKEVDTLIAEGAGSAVHHGLPLLENVEKKIPGAGSVDHILQYVLSMADNKKVVALGEEQLKKYISAWLGMQVMNVPKPGDVVATVTTEPAAPSTP